MTIEQYGWNKSWQSKWNDKLNGYEGKEYVPGRIIGDFGSKYRVMAETGETWGELAGKLRHTLTDSGEYPAIGDWVVLVMQDGGEHAVIHGVLPRHSVISRKVAGNTLDEQIVASNVDTLFLVSALNDDFNVRRMERYLIMAWNSGANPVILLTKADLCLDAESKIAEMERTAPGVAIHAVSALLGDGREELLPYISPGQTVALTGSSGCGKSTMVNWLSGRNLQLTQDVREGDSRGRHTTTHREMFVLPDGGIIVDTPGMRELQLWEDEGGLDLAFSDISVLAAECRFSDCRHEQEEGCAVLEAVASGELDEKRLWNYRKTQRELQYQSSKEVKHKRKTAAAATKAGSSRTRNSSWRRELDDL
ncbi:ribosome small subunit-dependent GTPase [Paenibacillus helianthi]|uniref:Small ribosomal subunit biogenesis GTPase RsgA n=1 Tax=Paenibacillus helianthi TaxID=1349432 RepID=A0ABX3EQX5_9BACL|nr:MULTISPECIES: ribosome small subunit-dependent GTPase A [Paenibacillus]OKP88339.1 ribosome small subunit-dependent GTPase [Paenibacillus helianthi]OKP88975.1 ribosome small subunit-dependent GTPase [Paenibacillus sp. P32E]